MNLGFATIPFPVLIFLAVIIFNIIGAINKQNKAQDRSEPVNEKKKKKFGQIAYDKLMEKKREAAHASDDCFTEEFVQEEFETPVECKVDKSDRFYDMNLRVKSKKRFVFGLTQLQQAVVMKEILDKPKSLQIGD